MVGANPSHCVLGLGMFSQEMNPLKRPFTCSASFLNSTPELIFATSVYSSSQLGAELCSAREEMVCNFAV